MKSNRSNYISIAFLTLFICVFAFKHAAACTQNFGLSNCYSLSAKNIKSYRTPQQHSDSSDQSLFENETEDESRTEFNSDLPVLSLSQNFDTPFLTKNTPAPSLANEKSNHQQHSLYLVICSFRI